MPIEHLDDHRPHATLQDPMTGRVHVVPMALIEDWANGELPPDPDCARAIIFDWLLASKIDEGGMSDA